MPDPARLATFCLVSLVLIVVPGPSVMFVVSRALSMGRRAAFATVVGNAVGEYVEVVAVSFGVGAVIQRSIVAFTVLKLVGAAYLVYLGVRTYRRRGELAAALDQVQVRRPVWRVWTDAFVVGVSNPKSLVFFGAVLPQFVDASAGHVTAQLLLLGLVFVVIALASDSAWGLAAGTARAWFARSPR
ncbi:MAG: LysE family translocator, partial [Pseudonocardia sp.]|nr:LysE family translocator [Pseudonocardia sp.]